jgi:U3 small nucleolar RNA-associated protein 5
LFYILTVTALDRANAEDALLPIPKVFDSREKEESFQDSLDKDVMDDMFTSGIADSMEIDGT